ncbi:MAG: hypothetical protein GY886_07565 [Gammaproteobacteria bacterium]|nr:hypothetical protein [Gammaproteobacteria bacterium]
MFFRSHQNLYKLAQTCTFLFPLLFHYSTVDASAWDWGSKASVSSFYRENPTLQSDDREQPSLFSLLATYEMDITRTSGNSRFTLTPRVTRSFYPDKKNKDLENTGYYIIGRSQYIRQTITWGLSFSASQESVLSDDNSIAQDGSRNFREDDIVHNFTLSPNFTWSITERDQFQLAFNAGVTNYDLDYTGRSDLENYSANAAYSHALSTRQKVGLSGYYSDSTAKGENCILNLNPFIPLPPPRFTPCDNDGLPPGLVNAFTKNKTNSLTLSFDYQFAVSSTSNLKIRYGLQQSDSTQQWRDANGNTLIANADGPSEEIATVYDSTSYNITFNKRMELYEFDLSARRSVQPSVEGTPQDKDQLTFNGKVKLSPRLTSELYINAWERESIFLASESNPTNFQRKTRYLQGNLSLSWLFTRKWGVSGTYTYRRRFQEKGLVEPSRLATSNSLQLNLTYKFKEIR